MNNIYEIFRKAQIEANKQKIHANAIVISPGLAYYAFDGETVTAMAYVMTPGRVYGMPSNGYYQTIHTGYKEHGIPTKTLSDALRSTSDKV